MSNLLLYSHLIQLVRNGRVNFIKTTRIYVHKVRFVRNELSFTHPDFDFAREMAHFLNEEMYTTHSFMTYLDTM